MTGAGFSPMTDKYVWEIISFFADADSINSLVSILVSRFILNLREEFGSDKRSTERTFDLSDMATVRFIEPSEDCPKERGEAADDLFKSFT